MRQTARRSLVLALFCASSSAALAQQRDPAIRVFVRASEGDTGSADDMLPEVEKVLRKDGADLGIAPAPSEAAAELTLLLTGAGMGSVPTGDSGPPPFYIRALLLEGRHSQSLSATAPNPQRSARELVKLLSSSLDYRRLSVLRRRADWPAVGLDFRTLQKAERKQLKIKDGEVMVLSVEQNGPAWTSGLRAADIVVRIAGRKLEASGELASALYTAAPGSSLSLEVYRQSGNQTVTLTLP